jgi:PKD repeat protein
MFMHIRHLYFVLVLALFTSLASAQAPTATIVMPSNPICTGKPYTFTSVTTGTIASYSWSLSPTSGFTVNSSDNFGSSINITFSSPITYSLTLVVSNGSGTFVTGGFVTVSRSATANYLAYLSDAGLPTNLVLSNASTNYTMLNWNFGGAAPTQTTETLLQPFTTPGNYTVSLIAFGSGGCNDTLDYAFTVSGTSDIKLVNVFTPNNDGVNDVF